jgi:hypothetical protein
MKRQPKYFFILISIITVLTSCDKEKTSTQLNPFYKLKVNGNLKTIDACGTSDYVAEYLRDTAVFAAFGCGGQRAGFYLKGQIVDGTYLLDNKNSAWFDEGAASYQTDSINKGTLTITSRIFQLTNGGRIPIVEGTFSFDAIDKNTGQKINVTSGQYLLKKYQY